MNDIDEEPRTAIMFDTRDLSDLRGEGWATIGPTRKTLYLSEHFNYPDHPHFNRAHSRLSGTRWESGFRVLAFEIAQSCSRVLAPPPIRARAVVVAMLRRDGFDACIGVGIRYRGNIMLAEDNIRTQADEDRLVRSVNGWRSWLRRPRQTVGAVEFPRDQDRRGYR